MAMVFPVCPALQGKRGFCFFGAMSGTRVVVFIDYQNVYHRARSSFGYRIESRPESRACLSAQGRRSTVQPRSLQRPKSNGHRRAGVLRKA